jgi:predicted ribosome quality control (RQC) complex YloA/Tae2 family protein
LEIRDELVGQNYIKKSLKNKKKKTKNLVSKPLHLISSENFDIFVGKNNIQNDILTLKTAHSNDLWLHTKDTAGSHVIIKTNGQTIPDQTLKEAAEICSFYSKARYSANVPVDYTIVKNVKKPSGAKPGMVIYKQFKTIYVTPDENIVNKLVCKE